MFNGVYANDAIISRTLNVPDPRTHGVGDNACGRGSAEDCTTIRYGHVDEIQYNERSSRNNDRNQSHENDKEITGVQT